jgi:methyl-accepting chemotaxis protein
MRLRFPMFTKFLIGCLALAAMLIIGGVMVVQNETRVRSRGAFMERQFRRYKGFQNGIGQAQASTVDYLAADPALRGALGRGGETAAPPVPGAATAPSAAPDEGAAERPAAGSAAGIAEQMYRTLSGKNGLKPDLFVLFSPTGDLLWTPSGSPVAPEDLREMSAVDKVRGGGAFFAEVLVHGDHAYQATGVPVRSPDGKRFVGGILVGVRLERYMLAYKALSDDKEESQQRLTLVVDGAVVASVLEEKDWPEFLKQSKEGAWVPVMDGEEKRQAIRLKAGDYDFAMENVTGYAGQKRDVIGTLILIRSRTTLEQPGRIPWMHLGIGVALSVLVASVLALWITRPIKQFVRQSRGMLEGETDLTQRIEVRSRDEVQDLAENINAVFARLYSLASGVQGAAFQVGASSAEISAASKQMLSGLRDQTQKIEGSTAAVTELSASIQQVAGNAAEATDVAEKSNVAVQTAVQRMVQIRGAVEEAADRMKELGDSSKRIGNIVEVIRQISEQTSLLALNASIEAAHAGEQGRGFAVVADEVSSLARRVGQSAKDIEALIQTIKEQTAAAVTSMEIGTREVENGTQLVTSTMGDLGQLISVVKETASAVQEQAVVSDEIARNMDAVQKIATEVLSGSEESVVQAETLHNLAFALEESVGGFNLDEASAARRPRGAPVGGNGRAGGRADGNGRTGRGDSGRGKRPAAERDRRLPGATAERRALSARPDDEAGADD